MYMIIIMWAHVCIILHNLNIRIKGDNFDNRWRESLVRWGMDCKSANGDTDEEPEGELEYVQWRIKDGQAAI